MAGQIYPTELQLNKANSFDTEALFVDLDLPITNGIVHLKFMMNGIIFILKKTTFHLLTEMFLTPLPMVYTRDVFYVRRKVDLMKTAKVNAYTMHIFGKIELLSIHAA